MNTRYNMADITRIEKLNATENWLGATIPKQEEKKSPGRFFNMSLFGFVVLFLLITLFTGTQVYENVNNARETSDNNRLGLSLIANSVRMNDTAGSIGEGIGPEGNRSLVLIERLASGDYETRIYQYQGKIVEEYAVASDAYMPEKAREIVASATFDFSYENGLLTIITDQGTATVALHSAGEV